MRSGFQITCANKNVNGTITRVGGPGWSLETHKAIVRLVTQRLRLNIVVDAVLYDIGVRGEGENTYLALEPDGRALHDIPGLPSC